MQSYETEIHRIRIMRDVKLIPLFEKQREAWKAALDSGDETARTRVLDGMNSVVQQCVPSPPPQPTLACNASVLCNAQRNTATAAVAC